MAGSVVEADMDDDGDTRYLRGPAGPNGTDEQWRAQRADEEAGCKTVEWGYRSGWHGRIVTKDNAGPLNLRKAVEHATLEGSAVYRREITTTDWLVADDVDSAGSS